MARELVFHELSLVKDILLGIVIAFFFSVWHLKAYFQDHYNPELAI